MPSQAFAEHLPSLCRTFAKPLPSRCHANPVPSLCQAKPFSKHLPSLCRTLSPPPPCGPPGPTGLKGFGTKRPCVDFSRPGRLCAVSAWLQPRFFVAQIVFCVLRLALWLDRFLVGPIGFLVVQIGFFVVSFLVVWNKCRWVSVYGSEVQSFSWSKSALTFKSKNWG